MAGTDPAFTGAAMLSAKASAGAAPLAGIIGIGIILRIVRVRLATVRSSTVRGQATTHAGLAFISTPLTLEV